MAVKVKNTKASGKTSAENPVGLDEKPKDEVITDLPVEDNIVTDDKTDIDPDSQYKTLLVGQAKTLSTKSNGLIGFELALNIDDKCRYLRLVSNTKNGLFSKEWLSLDALFELLDQQALDKPFKSSIFKAVINGKSANNCSFISAVLRCDEMGLILKSEKSQFLHLVNPLLVNQRDRLTKLKPLPTPTLK
ncbi:hypothetical protein NBRC116592_35110 [Colwellia sp. KU-HH00111]|uniref:hypothetical protein n=1 Tax=Colwellia sp. KU-HH00111 TaxID=3127652 RepID=UPI0031075C42